MKLIYIFQTAQLICNPAWLRRLSRGNDFNAERSVAYPYNEVYINSPKGSGYTRLDSYNPTAGEIVSRNFTQLSEVQEQTAVGYINELIAKYTVNEKNLGSGLAIIHFSSP
ncbi:hypothetical protein [Andreprevotia sp. IGB-42]|uniref:hypothetical protein n=1 Tax=Andreprevotia sp. IGB-42 TaxID=2497473 RepID=UPI001358B6E4|nr:hypothetical protein [Andreprevotia sp. IGB-42]